METISTILFQCSLITIMIAAALMIMHVRSDDYFNELALNSQYPLKQIKTVQRAFIAFFLIVLIVSFLILIS